MKKNIVILGAGIAGLSAGYFLTRRNDANVTIIEHSPNVGGMCASFDRNGFRLDFGPHKIYSVIPGILDTIVGIMGNDALAVPKKNKIFLKGNLLEYPLRLTNLLKITGPGLFTRIGTDFAAQQAINLGARQEPRSYEDFMVRKFGRATYNLIFEPLAAKVWGDPGTLHPDMARVRVPSLNTWLLILRLLKLAPEDASTSAVTYYYPRNGFGDFPLKLKKEIEAANGCIALNTQITGFERSGDRIRTVRIFHDGKAESLLCDVLISSIPLTELHQQFFPTSPRKDHLASRSLILVYLFINKERVLNDQWIFFPEKDFVFSRLSEQKNMSAQIAPADKTVLCCDFTAEDTGELWKKPDPELIDHCAQQLIDAGFIVRDDLLRDMCFVIRKKNFYPRYDLAYRESIEKISAELKSITNLIPTGRLGMFNYNNSDHCFDMGKIISVGIAENKSCPEIWNELEKRVRDYKIID